MPASSFDKAFEVKSEAEAERLMSVLKKPHKITRKSSFSVKERERSEELLKECISRSDVSKVQCDEMTDEDKNRIEMLNSLYGCRHDLGTIKTTVRELNQIDDKLSDEYRDKYHILCQLLEDMGSLLDTLGGQIDAGDISEDTLAAMHEIDYIERHPECKKGYNSGEEMMKDLLKNEKD